MIVEYCGHSTCDFNGRSEYCVVDANEAAGDSAIVIDLLDTLLYDKNNPDCLMQAQAVAGEFACTRQFTYASEDQEFGNWPAREMELTICHSRQRALSCDRYEIDVNWRVRYPGNAPYEHAVAYYIDVYPEGPVQSCIVEPDFINEKYVTRPMTGYDYITLFEEFEAINRFLPAS